MTNEELAAQIESVQDQLRQTVEIVGAVIALADTLQDRIAILENEQRLDELKKQGIIM